MRVLVTGAAGFIGFFTAERLAERGDTVVGVDNLNDYYDVGLKRARLARLEALPGFHFERVDVADQATWSRMFRRHRPDRVVHLAAQAGVRHSIENPHAYVDANVVGFLNVLESAREAGIDHVVYASTSAVYGANARMPFSTGDPVDQPMSMYAATKKSNELMAHAYSHLHGLPTSGLRFFTVYGPWGRPDMALFTFTRKILAGEPIDVYNHGNHRRDFTYVDDIVEGMVRVLDKPPRPGDAAPYRLLNIGNGRPVELLAFIDAIESALGRKARRNLLPLQPGDVPETFADIEPLVRDFGYRPETTIDTGITRFIAWYRDYYGNAGPEPGGT